MNRRKIEDIEVSLENPKCSNCEMSKRRILCTICKRMYGSCDLCRPSGHAPGCGCHPLEHELNRNEE